MRIEIEGNWTIPHEEVRREDKGPGRPTVSGSCGNRAVDEKQWLGATAPRGGLDYLCSDGWSRGAGLSEHRRKAGRRKLRLFTCACARRVWELVPAGPCRAAVELGERLAEGDNVAAQIAALPDGRLDAGVLSRRHAAHAAVVCVEVNLRWASVVGAQAAAMAVGWALEEVENSAKLQTYNRGRSEEEQVQAALLLDIFGNPFRPVAVERRWLTSTVVALAQGIYKDRAFDRLPILADALMDAECDQENLLDHCRSPGPHVRGCWVVDLLLDKGRTRRGTA